MRLISAAGTWVAFWAAAAACWGQPAGGAADVVTLVQADGSRQAGTLAELSDESLTVDGRPQATRDLFKAVWEVRSVGPAAGAPLVLLGNGDLLLLAPQGIEDEHLIAAWARFPHWAPLRIPLETVRGFITPLPEQASEQPALLRFVQETVKDDRLVLQNGDRLFGEILGASASELSIQSAVGKAAIDRATVAAVGFNAEWISFPKVEGPRMLFSLVDGSHLTASAVRLKAGMLQMKAAFGGEVEIPLEAVAAIRFLWGRVEYLSDREPVDYQFTPYLSGEWPLGRDRNAAGGLLRLGGAVFPKGLGMHSRSEATYDLGKAYSQFFSQAGMEETAGARAAATFAVEVDGDRVFERTLSAGEAPVTVGPIDLRGKERLKLVVDYGPYGDMQDLANWVDAAVVK